MSVDSPAFGQADLSNCERELIHLAGSVQPHGVLLLLQEPELRVLQASANCAVVLGTPVQALLGQPLAVLGGDVAAQVLQRLAALGESPSSLRATWATNGCWRARCTGHRAAVGVQGHSYRSSMVLGQLALSSRLSARSASSLPPVWQRAQ